MKGSELIWTVLVLVVFLFVDYLLVFPKTVHGTTVNVSIGTGHSVTILGATEVKVSAADNSYFRITAGGTMLEGHPNTIDGHQFTAQGTLPAEGWVIRNGEGIDMTITNPTLMIVTTALTPTVFWTITVLLFLLAIVVWLLGLETLP